MSNDLKFRSEKEAQEWLAQLQARSSTSEAAKRNLEKLSEQFADIEKNTNETAELLKKQEKRESKREAQSKTEPSGTVDSGETSDAVRPISTKEKVGDFMSAVFWKTLDMEQLGERVQAASKSKKDKAFASSLISSDSPVSEEQAAEQVQQQEMALEEQEDQTTLLEQIAENTEPNISEDVEEKENTKSDNSLLADLFSSTLLKGLGPMLVTLGTTIVAGVGLALIAKFGGDALNDTITDNMMQGTDQDLVDDLNTLKFKEDAGEWLTPLDEERKEKLQQELKSRNVEYNVVTEKRSWWQGGGEDELYKIGPKPSPEPEQPKKEPTVFEQYAPNGPVEPTVTDEDTKKVEPVETPDESISPKVSKFREGAVKAQKAAAIEKRKFESVKAELGETEVIGYDEDFGDDIYGYKDAEKQKKYEEASKAYYDARNKADRYNPINTDRKNKGTAYQAIDMRARELADQMGIDSTGNLDYTLAGGDVVKTIEGKDVPVELLTDYEMDKINEVTMVRASMEGKEPGKLLERGEEPAQIAEPKQPEPTVTDEETQVAEPVQTPNTQGEKPAQIAEPKQPEPTVTDEDTKVAEPAQTPKTQREQLKDSFGRGEKTEKQKFIEDYIKKHPPRTKSSRSMQAAINKAKMAWNKQKLDAVGATQGTMKGDELVSHNGPGNIETVPKEQNVPDEKPVDDSAKKLGEEIGKNIKVPPAIVPPQAPAKDKVVPAPFTQTMKNNEGSANNFMADRSCF